MPVAQMELPITDPQKRFCPQIIKDKKNLKGYSVKVCVKVFFNAKYVNYVHMRKMCI